MYMEQRTSAGFERAPATTYIGRMETAPRKTSAASPLFTRLINSVNRKRLLLDRCYFQLVSEIAELLSDEEVALLALYLAPPLAVGLPSREHRLARSIMRKRTKGKTHA